MGAACTCNWCQAAAVARHAARALATAVIVLVLFVVTPVLTTAARGAIACGAGYVPAVHHTLTGLEEDEYWDTYCAPHGY